MKPSLIIAGPGSGKTHNLVDCIIESLQFLEAYRALAAITYTNAATNSIKQKLEKRIRIPHNVFIGTTYSFFNSFILLPYASLYENIDIDKIFIEYDIIEQAEKITKNKGISDSQKIMYQKGVEKKILHGLLSKGVIPFEQIAKISADLISKKRIREIVGHRLQYLFVDEFQDCTSHQYKVFEEIRKEKKTKIYSVGDPEQYISNHTIKGRSIPLFHKIPILDFQKNCSVTVEEKNRRSSAEIVQFINRFNTQMQQQSLKGSVKDSHVRFIQNKVLDNIVGEFRNISKTVETKNGYTRFYLAYANNAYDSVKIKYQLQTISHEHLRSHSKLSESLKILSSVTGLSSRKICLKHCIDNISYRMMGVSLLRSRIDSPDGLKAFCQKQLKLQVSKEANFNALFEKWKILMTNNPYTNNSEITTSIHKSKGLEADAVLVLSRTNNELTKWLETDKQARFADKTDQHRLGFVGFSRAREILCLACLEDIDKANREKLTNWNVIF